MNLDVRIAPRMTANHVGITECHNANVLTDYVEKRQALGLRACAVCNGCRIFAGTVYCSATVSAEGHSYEGKDLPLVVPGIDMEFPVSRAAYIPQPDAEIVVLQQGELNEQAA